MDGVVGPVGLRLRRISPAIGAVAEGLDLSQPLAAEQVRQVRAAVLEHGVVFFRRQKLDDAQMLAFMSNFGTPCMDPFSEPAPVQPKDTIINMPTRGNSRATAVWHIDSSLAPEPASLMALRAVTLPPLGGDTCFGSMVAAYEALSQPIKELIDGLTAEHSAFKVLPLLEAGVGDYLQRGLRSVHPMVRVHPETGKKALMANELWTEAVVELSAIEGAHLLAMLYEHAKLPEFTTRWTWEVDDLAFWDNRSLQHYAVRDYDSVRVLQKSLLAGDRPVGPRG